MCLPSDALLQHLPSYLGFSYLGHGVSLHGCSSKAQPLLLTLDEGYLLTTAPPDLERGIAPLGPPALRNINNLRYADDTTFMTESEEELKSLLMKVKVESEKLFKAQHSENEDHGIRSHHFILSGVISPLISSSILGTS